MRIQMIFIENKLLNLYFILKNIYKNKNVYISYNSRYGIKVITDNNNLFKEIKNIPYFKLNYFKINESSYEFTPYIFYINYCMPLHDTFYLSDVYDDYLNILNNFNVNIHMISEEGFMIDNPDLETLNKIHDQLFKKYNYANINTHHIFLIKSLNQLSR